ncbi:cytochrome b/b6 domain-containing protein [Vibrio alfacsensis]|uniref:cytochrome b/b6 domain-containing protein n=1 Tax=Vibrio alfacsensis TaxID=1074311 RepID=UPI0040692AD7
MENKLKLGLKTLFETLPNIERYLHFAVLFWVLLQLLSSGLMHVHGDTELSQISDLAFIHIYSGLALLPVCLIFATKVIMRRKIQDLYPWVSGNYHAIKEDIESVLKFELPEAKPSGLAATVEGLGILALILAVVTGSMWYLVVLTSGPSEWLLSIHKMSVTFIQVYFFGHALFALLHLVQWWRESSAS